MPASFITSDITHMTDSSIFGESDATWKTISVAGIFDDEDVEVQMGEGVGQIVPQPMFTGLTSDFPGIADGDAMVIGGQNFKVKNWKQDGTGQIEIFLERV